MARSRAFQSLARIIRIARFCDRHGLSTKETTGGNNVPQTLPES